MIYSSASLSCFFRYWVVPLFIFLVILSPVSQADEWKTSGHLKYYFSHTRYDADNIFTQAGHHVLNDHATNLRLTVNNRWQSKWDAVIHYDIGVQRRDSIETARSINLQQDLAGYGLPNDDARLFNLTGVIIGDENDDGKNLFYHRLDRISAGYTEADYVFRFGRQVVSWGNGLVFQPMDIFNPFSPTATDTEYKTGDDMIYLQNLMNDGDDIQTVLIPRRDTSTGNLETNESSLAVKYHTIYGDTDIDLLVSRHFSVNLAGIGFAADWKGSVLRGDLVNLWNSGESVLSGVVSINYSWIWGEHNVSGFLEYYRNGNGINDDDYSPTALADNQLLTNRISRGEIFTLGQDYLAGGLTVELTPRWLFNPLLVNNMNDSSWLTQWTATFDWKQNLSLLLGANFRFGDKGTEYGGIPSVTSGVYSGGGRSVYLQLAYYF